jgi:ATP-dependent Lon protease
MKESVLTAISWIKSTMNSLVPPPSNHPSEGLDGIDLHVHFPAAATPKDGPSAGVTITTALVSLLTGAKVSSDIAMTGEISLKGVVLPVGGIKEKVLAAHRQGLKRVILPAKNKKDLREVPEEVKNDLQIYFTTNVYENLELALTAFNFSEYVDMAKINPKL